MLSKNGSGEKAFRKTFKQYAHRETRQHKPGLAQEREVRETMIVYQHAVLFVQAQLFISVEF